MTKTQSKPSVTRVHFIEQFMQHGLNYTQACGAYEAMSSLFENAIIQGSKVNIGRVGAIVPIRLEPKVVHMGFSNTGGTVKKVKREYILGRRIRYKFSVHKTFLQKHSLDWL